MIFLRLYWEFFKTGLFAIGGGLATLPFLYEMQARTGWFTVNDVANMVAVSESTPGPMGINMATYVGFTIAGIPGAIIAVIGEVSPAIVIIYIIGKILAKFKENKYVQYAMYGLRAASAGLIFVAGLQVARIAFLHTDMIGKGAGLASIFNPVAIVLGIAIAVVYKLTKKHPILYILAAGVAGVLLAL